MSGAATDEFRRAAVYAALCAAGLFLIVGGFHVGDLTRAIYQDGDHASGPVISELFGARGSGEVTLGNFPWLESLFLDHWSRGLPDHRTLWEAWPFLLYFASAAVVGWTVALATSRHVGILVGLAMAIPAAPVISDLASPTYRGTSFAHAVLLSAFLVLLPRVARARTTVKLAWAVGLALSLVPGVASDPRLILVWAVGPFLVAVSVAWLTRVVGARVAGLAAISAVAGTALGYGLIKIAEHHGIGYYHLPIELDTITRLPTNVRFWFENVATFAHGRFQEPVLSSRALGWVAGGAALVGIPLLSIGVARRLPDHLTGPERRSEAGLLLAFWATVLAAMTVVFLVPLTAITIDVGSLRYVTILWPALLVLGGVTWGDRSVPWLACLVVATAVLGCVELVRGDYGGSAPWLSEGEISGVSRFVEANELDHGYAPYQDAAPLTWASDFEVKSYPINMCGSAVPAPDRCQFSLHTMDSWYRPTHGVRTFYLWDDRRLSGDRYLAPPPHRWGRPFATANFGHLHLYAYDYDLGRQVRLPPARQDAG